MHRKLWARLLSCVVALSLVLAAVPKPAQAVYYVVGDGGSYALMEYFRHRWPDGGYKLWTDYPQEFRAIISNGGNAFTNYSQGWVGMDYLIGKYGVQEPEDMGTNSADVLSQLNAARQAFDDAWAQYQETNKPYQPGGIGGGSTASTPDEPSLPVDGWFTGTVPTSGTLYACNKDYWASKSVVLPDTITFSNMPAVSVNEANNILSQHQGFKCVVVASTYSKTLQYWCVPSDAQIAFHDGRVCCYVEGDWTRWSTYIGSLSFSGNVLSGGANFPGGPWSANYNGFGAIFDNSGPVTHISIVNADDFVIGDNPGGGTGGTVNPVPDPSTIEKPESPVSPTNPQTPERDSPTIVIGGTTQTVPDPSPAPDLSTIEDLLRRILANTNTIIEQMNSFASQLGQELSDFYDMVYDWFARLDSWLDQLQAQMTRQLAWDNSFFDWLKAIDSDIQYLQSVCQNGFNDVTSWLQNIFNRMVQGNGGGSKPGIVDPTDPSPVTDWLRQLWTSFLADLQMVLPNQVGAVVDFLDQLRQKFPFSIPWDIAAMLALLNHAPVTPVIDIPWGYAGHVQSIHVDCHAWDDAVELVRPMFLLLFALGLALLTRELLAGLEAVL